MVAIIVVIWYYFMCLKDTRSTLIRELERERQCLKDILN